jgi:hypothetical protein
MGWIQSANILEMLILLMLANGAPVIAKKILDNRFSYPMDAQICFVDGNRLFGPSKTIRGIVLAVLATAAGATLIGLDWMLGALVGSTAMLGDLFSSLSSVGWACRRAAKHLVLIKSPKLCSRSSCAAPGWLWGSATFSLC